MTYVNENEIIHPCQIGFMPGNRTADHVLTLKTLHDKHVKQNNNGKFMPASLILRKRSIQFGTTASSQNY